MKPIDIKVGDIVTRNLLGTITDLKVASVGENLIDCGWTFDKRTGAEVDVVLGWTATESGSYLTHCNGKKLDLD